MSDINTQVRVLILELNQLRIERQMEEQTRTDREKEILQELIKLTVEGSN